MSISTFKDSNFISAVIYIHNSESLIEEFFSVIDKALNEHFKKYEIIFVNDCSSDNSKAVIKRVAQKNDNAMISILNMSSYQGVEQAMNAGVDLAIGDFVYEFDQVAFNFDPQLIMDIYHRSLTGYDIVSASPNIGMRASSKLFYRIYNRFSKTSYPLKTESFRVLSRRVINRIQAMNSVILYRKALYANSGLCQDTIYFKPTGNAKTLGALENNMRKDLAIDSIVLFTDVAYKITFAFALLMMLLAIVMGIYAAVIFIGRQPVAGWTTTMLFLSISFFGIFIILTIIIKYLSVLIKLIFHKQSYSIESIEKISH